MARTIFVSSLQNSASVSSLLFTFLSARWQPYCYPYEILSSFLRPSVLQFDNSELPPLPAYWQNFSRQPIWEISFTPSFYSCLWWWWWCPFFVALFKILKLGTEPSYTTATENIPVHPRSQIGVQLSLLGAGVANYYILSRSLLLKVLTYELFRVLVTERELLIKRHHIVMVV